MPSSSHKRLQDDRRTRQLHTITNNSNPNVIPNRFSGEESAFRPERTADSSDLKVLGMTVVFLG